jgi:hypothetical protein
MESVTQFLVVFSSVCSQLVSGHYGLDYPPEPNETNELKDPQHERLFYSNKPDEEFYRELKFRVVGWDHYMLSSIVCENSSVIFLFRAVKIRLSTMIITCSTIMTL